MSEKKEMPPLIILCGGQGTRLRDVAELVPKPMVPIGPHPMVWHIMKIYSAYGVNRFILCLGYLRHVFIDYFIHYHEHSFDITLKLGRKQEIIYHKLDHHEEEWEVTLANTGEKTMTGARIAIAASKYLREKDQDFFLTYGDAVADINIKELWEYHKKKKKELTVSAVHPAGRFGEMQIQNGEVTRFHEKPQTEAGFINGGFMVAKRSFVSKYLSVQPHLVLEEEPMQKAVKDGEMVAYEHLGFWQCMDTPREHNLLNQMWESGNAPWTKGWK